MEYQYDVNGDLEYRVDPVKTPDVNLDIDYKYDALGRLVKRVKGSQWTKYTYDGDDVVLDVRSDTTQVYYGDGPGIDNKLWYEEGSANPVFFLTDHLGSTRALVSSTGSIIPGTQIDYDSFGVPSTTLPTRFQYAGREYDPDTELYYYRARWYDPKARRFVSEDPIGLEGGINLYAYVGNNAINLTDPFGLVDAPGFWEGIIPFWGSGKDAWHNFENGNYVWGTVYTALAVSDVFLAKAIVTGIAKGAGKGLLKQGAKEAGEIICTASPKALGRALEAAGHVRKAGHAAHHIVAGNAPAAAPARAVLKRFGIGINDAVNGVFLPANRASINATGAAVHSSLHTNAYYNTVNQMLLGATNRAEAEAALEAIGKELLSGGL